MRYLLAALLALTFASPVFAAPSFPALTGRVVDEAHVLSAATKQNLEGELANLEARTSDQLVVVTLASLEGLTIEDYGYQLGRHWGIGQKGKDNGVLLIVAPKERKVRIEVGYGLEGTLTDAMTRNIIETKIIPAFKQNNMPQAIVDGVHGIIFVATGGVLAPAQSGQQDAQGNSSGALLIALVIGLFLFSQVLLFVLYAVLWIVGSILSLFGLNGLLDFARRQRARIFPADRALLFWLLMPSGRFTGSGGGSFRSGGGFSGGGGGFGGGGSSGSW